ncbi:DUF992 domain-containing protein [Phreatobacter sp. AB_2022a]|uniref:DUF992 domain-containing protein n=1 Tax=Phreatobacter sp. AB_2022a TaxID=3003134 RepID=UPI000570CEE7|nr:DUF992 domain-containing protein [Phreatobacter sp. AB_2022a]MCZ0737016.1 DUF992 domain-containing protein [Phreatobacter sp. AB_2022a]CEJ09927.1 hypothetical protein BN1110_00198 [bacterium YEK0313]
MNRPLIALAGATLLAAGFAAPAAAQQRVRAGVLTCDVSAGIGLIVTSQRGVACQFRPDRRGRPEYYVGRIARYGLDLGITGRGVLAWTVFTAQRRYQRYQLAGNYGGASAEATLAVGLGANALVGGSRNSVALQPFSVQAQTGANLALGVAELRLRPGR